MLCPNCGHENRSTARFCTRCSEMLALPASEDIHSEAPASTVGALFSQPDTVPCVNCGQMVAIESRFCKFCGSRRQPDDGAASLQGDHNPPDADSVASDASIVTRDGTSHRSNYLLRHLIAIGTLTLGLMLALGVAYSFSRTQIETIIALPAPTVPPPPTPTPTATPDYRQSVLAIRTNDQGTFGLVAQAEDSSSGIGENKRLTFSDRGTGNSVVVKIADREFVHGDPNSGGAYIVPPKYEQGSLMSVWAVVGVEIEQLTRFVYGDLPPRVDTVEVRYVLTNRDVVTKEIGVRFLLDTLIGQEDGVPFVVPGSPDIIQKSIRLEGSLVPDYILALERPDLAQPGIIAKFYLHGDGVIPPDQVIISGWCGNLAVWDYLDRIGGEGRPLRQCGIETGKPDSAVGIYYEPWPIPPRESREVVFRYGLGSISSANTGNSSLSLAFNRTVLQNEPFWVTALVVTPQSGQRVRLDLPPGLEVVAGTELDQSLIADNYYTQVSWRVISRVPGDELPISIVLLPQEISETQIVNVLPAGLTR